MQKVEFTKEMKKDYTILVPNMLPVHFKLISKILISYGYNIELLNTTGKHIADTGLKYVHNDMCYPALLVIGQLIDAVQSGKYDVHKIALLITQTGGGCRASNYIYLLRKALQKADLGFIPVISFNFTGVEKSPGFNLTLPIYLKLFSAVMYGDLLMLLKNQLFAILSKLEGSSHNSSVLFLKVISDDTSIIFKFLFCLSIGFT